VRDFSPNLAFRHAFLRGNWCTDLCTVVALAVFAVGTPWLCSQTPVSSDAKPRLKPVSSSLRKIAAIKSFRIIQENDGSAVEILSTRPLVPAIHAIDKPDRLVIDLPNARLDTPEKLISVRADQISGIRADQFQQNPPVARLVVDLLAPRTYTWDAAGNILVVHLGKNPNEPTASPFQAPTVLSLTPAPQPVVAAVRAAGPLTLTENDARPGSSITAGADTAVLNLSSGGEVHVCPGTTVSVTPSQNRHNMMLSMNTGALEAHFALDATSDSIMTPDFRILLVGPGEFHYAVSADSQGNTCVRALPGNTASAIVNELLGDRTYQVKATDQLVFRSGQLDHVDMAVPLECGCPPPRDAPLRAENNLPVESRAQRGVTPLKASPAVDSDTAPAETVRSTGIPATTAPVDVSASASPNELHVQVEAPFVFHATGPPPAPVEEVRALRFDSRPGAAPALAAPLPPPASETPEANGAAAAKRPSRGFFRKIGGFLAALFR